ncbi:MAG: hypothetical protein ABSG81_12780 [Acidimicrobiales bacterium]|jgi:hypothetical protein
MKHTLRSRVAPGLAAAAVVAALVAAVPGVAAADSSTATTAGSTATTGGTTAGSSVTTVQPSNPFCTRALFGAAQQRVEADLSNRVSQLNTLLASVNNTANHLTTGDRQTLLNDVSTVELPGIQALVPQVQQATTCPQLRSAARAMVFNYRVWVVMTPQTHFTVVADDETFIEGQFASFEPTIAEDIQNAQASGKDVTAAEASFTDLKNQIAAAQSATSGQDATLLAQTPQGAPGNWSVFLAARSSLASARNDLRAAYNDGLQIKADLQ